ncbi:endonuclease/exonuclease/phosphatase family protein [Aliidiomarina sedimenti]|uniref:Endonuclease/exonuclease/phosphatase family protein n=1 Tax=Aliidiomarina sedimenti TaxID=1933879 RepID=A0ABY0C350_9GAMM|nr:endonuclease/exonuclease/phosphatase family protein [Aliidiomarina sedimenti]RUO32271.1 endonuclease/exonuclease/phosphatase family protein [Aliidiomarina sedimenti]
MVAGVWAGQASATIRVATFNVSMEADNYLPRGEQGDQQVLIERLASGDEAQIQNVAEIIQRTRPDILFLTEFDYIADPGKGVEAFSTNYLQVAQGGQQPIDYPYYYYAPVNTGQPSPYDLDRDGVASGTGADAWGFGSYPGQYGMLVLSKYPINKDQVRTFQQFKWKDMPDYLPTRTADGDDWYSEEAWQDFPLSSKSHWDLPIEVDGETLHLLASHPTPPVFDGPENRNGIRNHDEIRFWRDYIHNAEYIYDDRNQSGGLAAQQRFFIVGDLNASADEGDGIRSAIAGLLNDELVQGAAEPVSSGAAAHSESAYAASHTAAWGMRADYVIPSVYGVTVVDSGVFWPAAGEPGHGLVSSRGASSDHRLVWLDVRLK